jgi:hypothetical protein
MFMTHRSALMTLQNATLDNKRTLSLVSIFSVCCYSRVSISIILSPLNTALEYSTGVVQEGDRRCKKSTLNDLVHLTPLRIPVMNAPNSIHLFCDAESNSRLHKKGGRKDRLRFKKTSSR